MLHIDQTMQLIEIGPDHSPIIAKADGWRTVVIDHASQQYFLEKYRAMEVSTPDRIELVDFVWRGGSLSELISPIRSIEPASSVDFYVWLERKRLVCPRPR
jgi:hypothetical protein